MAVEDGEDFQDLADRTRGNRLTKESDPPGRGMPTSETGARGRTVRKAKAKMADYEAPVTVGKRNHEVNVCDTVDQWRG